MRERSRLLRRVDGLFFGFGELGLGLPTTATAVLLLLALASHRAREHVDRHRPVASGQERAETNSVS